MGKLITDLFKPGRIRGARTIKSPANDAYLKSVERTRQEVRDKRRRTPEQVRRTLIPIGA